MVLTLLTMINIMLWLCWIFTVHMAHPRGERQIVKYPAQPGLVNLVVKAWSDILWTISLVRWFLGLWLPPLKRRKVRNPESDRTKSVRDFDRKATAKVVKKTLRFLRTLALNKALLKTLDGIEKGQLALIAKVDPKLLASWLKEDFLIIKNFFLIGKTTEVNQSKVWRKTARTLPVPPYLVPVFNIKWTRWDKILLMSALRTYRYISVPTPHDLSTIVRGLSLRRWWSVIVVGYEIISRWDALGFPNSMLGYRPPKLDSINPWALWSPGSLDLKTFKASGPNGLHLWGRVSDLFVIANKPILICLIESFLSNWCQVLKLPRIPGAIRGPRGLLNWLGWESIWNLKSKIKGAFHLHNTLNFGKCRRLAVFRDGAGKWRYIAIGDWLTQLTLRPVHVMIIALLKSIPIDATYDQQKIHLVSKEWALLGKKAHSIDLSAATDRIPIILQVLVMWKLFGVGRLPIALAWWGIIVIEPFHSKQFGAVRYLTGQGMGIYSSWTMMAITHHALVRLAADMRGKGGAFEDYLLLGDDLVIADKEVAECYIKIITDLGVGISMIKSVIGNDTHLGVEFASQYLLGAENLSPLPIGLIHEGTTEALFSLWDTLWERGYCENSVSPELSVAHDFKVEFPLSGKKEAHSKLRTMWGVSLITRLVAGKPDYFLHMGLIPPVMGSEKDRYVQWLLSFYRLDLVHKFLGLKKAVAFQTFQKNLNAVEKHAFDRSSFTGNLLKAVPRHALETHEYLIGWSELWILFQSPFLSVQTRLELELEEYHSARDSVGLPMPWIGFTLNKVLWANTTFGTSDMDFIEEVAHLALGPIALYLRRALTLREPKWMAKSVRSRLNAAKVRRHWESKILMRALELTLNRGFSTQHKYPRPTQPPVIESEISVPMGWWRVRVIQSVPSDPSIL